MAAGRRRRPPRYCAVSRSAAAVHGAFQSVHVSTHAEAGEKRTRIRDPRNERRFTQPAPRTVLFGRELVPVPARFVLDGLGRRRRSRSHSSHSCGRCRPPPVAPAVTTARRRKRHHRPCSHYRRRMERYRPRGKHRKQQQVQQKERTKLDRNGASLRCTQRPDVGPAHSYCRMHQCQNQNLLGLVLRRYSSQWTIRYVMSKSDALILCGKLIVNSIDVNNCKVILTVEVRSQLQGSLITVISFEKHSDPVSLPIRT
jgi:hypothetical protein